VIRTIDDMLLAAPHPYTVVVRSTIPPGTMERFVLPILRSGARQVLGPALKVCCNPEFLREGSAINDFFNPPYIVIGLAETGAESDAIVEEVETAYGLATAAPTVRLGFREAELLKVICNAFHALKIAFANEVGAVAARVGANPIALMDAFVLDTKLNISPVYLRPGFAFGGSCLPKDIRGLLHVGHTADLRMPLCESILPSNDEHLQRALSAVMAQPGRVVGLAGVVFKPHTDDVRESPAIWLARRIIDAGRTLLIYEPEINVGRLIGANLAFIEENLPEYRQCLVGWEALAGQADVIAVAHGQLTQPVVALYRLGWSV
jgi:GDP-mannose 6-dehydrogenase